MEYNDDPVVALIVTKCLHIMRDFPTQTNMTACFNLTEKIMRLFTVFGEKEDVFRMIDDMAEMLKEEMGKCYDD